MSEISRQLAYYRAHREECKARVRRYYHRNKKELRIKAQKWKKEHPDYWREYYKEHAEEMKLKRLKKEEEQIGKQAE